MTKAKSSKAPKPAGKGGKLTSQRLLKNRPHEAEPDAKSKAAGEREETAETAKPQQARLPEMEDPEIEELEAAAEEYAEIRDRRQQMTAQEVPAKEKLLNLMKAHEKTHYKRDGIEITRTVEKEKVRVRIKKETKDGE